MHKTFQTGRHALWALALTLSVSAAHADLGKPEKTELKFGFIKLTDMAPLAIAYEKRYFEDEGLYVSLEAQANWKVLLAGVGCAPSFWRTRKECCYLPLFAVRHTLKLG